MPIITPPVTGPVAAAYATAPERWWAVTTAAGHTGRGEAEEPGTTTYVESATEPPIPPGGSVRGPFATKPGAQEGAASLGPNVHLPNPLSGIEAIGAFFNNLGSRELWIRIAKVGIGIVMIITGLSKLTGAGSKIEAVASKIPPIVPV